MNGKEGLRHEVGFYHSENKRLRRELKMMSAQLDRLIEEKPEKKKVEHDSLAEKSALLNSLYKKCSIFKREKNNLKEKIIKFNSEDFLEKLQNSIKKLTKKLEKLEKLDKKNKVFKDTEKNLETSSNEREIRSLTYEKYDLLQKIMETEKNLKNINEKIVYSSNKAASLEQDLKKIKLNRPGLDLEKVEKIEKSEKTENGKLMERQSKARIATVLNSMSSSKILSSKLKYLESELVSLNKTQEKIQENLQEKDKTLNRFKSQLKVLPEFDLFRSASVQPGRLKINPLKRYHK